MHDNFTNYIQTPKIALDLLQKYVLIAKDINQNITYYLLHDNTIMVINEHYKYYINIEKFIEDFYYTKFFIYEECNNIDKEIEYFYKRQ